MVGPLIGRLGRFERRRSPRHQTPQAGPVRVSSAETRPDNAWGARYLVRGVETVRIGRTGVSEGQAV